jgi:hypothetical protein
MREKAKSSGVQSLSSLIASFSEWIETEILERQSSKSAKGELTASEMSRNSAIGWFATTGS